MGTTVRSARAQVVTSLFLPEIHKVHSAAQRVAWDGLGPTGQPLPGGTYSVVVIPASSGYTNGFSTSDTADPNTYVFDGRGLTVDRNSVSPYFGESLSLIAPP
jgi:hypothetical protein